MNSFESRTSTLNIYAKVEAEQLGYCNAFVRACYLQYRNGFILAKRELVSYCTPVLAIGYGLNGEPLRVTCAPAATCSATTRKHVGRFLNESCVPITYLGVKGALETPIKPDNYNGLRLIDLNTGLIEGYDDTNNMFGVRYDSIKQFSNWY